MIRDRSTNCRHRHAIQPVRSYGIEWCPDCGACRAGVGHRWKVPVHARLWYRRQRAIGELT